MKFLPSIPVILAALPAFFMSIAGMLDIGKDPVTITVALLSAVAGWTLSWVVERNPKIASKFNQLDSIGKSRVFIGLLAIVSLFIVGLACNQYTAEFFSHYIVMTCSDSGFIQLGEAFFMAVLASQGRFQLYAKPRKKTSVRLSREFMETRDMDKTVGQLLEELDSMTTEKAAAYEVDAHGGQHEN